MLKWANIYCKFSHLYILYMSSIRVENVVKPPHIPTDINKKISFL